MIRMSADADISNMFTQVATMHYDTVEFRIEPLDLDRLFTTRITDRECASVFLIGSRCITRITMGISERDE